MRMLKSRLVIQEEDESPFPVRSCVEVSWSLLGPGDPSTTPVARDPQTHP